jgi:hypothetical protein
MCLQAIASPQIAQDQALMVEAVKAFQKTGRDARSGWNNYCDVYARGVRDPCRHPPAFLRRFFELRDRGGLPEFEAPIHERSLSSALSEKDYRAILDAKVQQAMRKPSLRQCFRQRFGAIKAKAVDSLALLEFLCTVEQADTRNPYASPARFQSPWGQCVKKMQSSRLQWKVQWDAFVERYGCGVRDPSRHPPEFLITFLKQVSPPCPNPMLKEFGLNPEDLQFKEVDPRVGPASPRTHSSDPESIEFSEAPLNMHCFSMGKSQAIVPAEVHAESNATVCFNEGRQRRLKPHGDSNTRAASWPPVKPLRKEVITSYALSFRIQNTFLVVDCDP